MPRKIVYPRHAKAFAKPIRLDYAGRKQVGVTPLIRNYVAGFKAGGKLDLARKIVEDIRSFERAALSMEKAKRLWGKRSASDVIKTRKVYMMIPAEAATTGKPAIIGCTDSGIAVTAALRAAGFDARIVREGTHTYTKFFYRGNVYIADTRDTKRSMLRPMSRADKKVENQYRAANAFAEGASLASIGLKSYSDFFKYRYMKKG